MVVALRERYGWGARKVRVLLAERGCHLPEITINRILKRRGLVPAAKRMGQATRRFAREQCNELAQLDLKGEYRVEGGWCYPLTLLDDCSRYLLGLWALPSMSTEPVQEALRGHFREHGMPQALLLDHGTPWWSPSSGHGLTRLSVWLMKHELALIWAAVRHPQTLGKVERFHRTFDERSRHEGLPETLEGWQEWVPRLRWEYNQVRPHEALEMKTPAQVYVPDNLRAYREPPPKWDYGDARTQALDSGGFVSWNRQRHFVSEALAGERVRIDVREIDLHTGKTSAVLLHPPKL
jgi:transposase InsO family protein